MPTRPCRRLSRRREARLSGNIVGKRARLTIIRDRGTNTEEAITETILLGPSDQKIRLSLSSGRRPTGECRTADILIPKRLRTKPTGPSPVLAQLGGGGVGARHWPAMPMSVGFTHADHDIRERGRSNECDGSRVRRSKICADQCETGLFNNYRGFLIHVFKIVNERRQSSKQYSSCGWVICRSD